MRVLAVAALLVAPGLGGRAGAIRAQELPDAGNYEVGIDGRDRDGNPTRMRSFIFAVRAGLHENPDSQALAEALAWMTRDLLVSMPAFPQAVDFPLVARNVPQRDPNWGELVLSREQGLIAARQLGQDALLVIAANDDGAAGADLSYELLDMADESPVASGDLRAASAAGLLELVPALFLELFESVGVELSEADRSLLATPPFAPEEYACAGHFLSHVPSREEYDLAQTFVQTHPSSGLAQLIQRRTFRDDWPTEESLAWLQAWAHQFAPGRPIVLAIASEEAGRVGADEQAQALADQYAAAKGPSIAADRLNLILVSKRHAYDEAIALCQRIVSACPMSAEAWLWLAQAHWNKASDARGGRFLSDITPEELETFSSHVDTARDAIEQATLLGPQNADILAKLIALRRETGETDLCKEALDQCDAVRPGYVPAYREMEWLYTKGYQDDEQARRDVLIRLSGQVALGMSDEIEIAAFLDHEAPFGYWKPHYERALAIAPFDPPALRRMGEEVLAATNWVPDQRAAEEFIAEYSLKALHKSLDQRPTFLTKRALGKALNRARRFEEAEQVLLPLAAERPEDAQTRLLLARVQRARGEFPEAAQSFQAALERLDKQTWDAVDAYAGAIQCTAVADPAAARKLLDQNLVNYTAGGDRYNRSSKQLFCLAARDFERVPSFLEGTEEGDPYNWFLWHSVALARMGQGDWRGAVEAIDLGMKVAPHVKLRPPLLACRHKLGDAKTARELWDFVMQHDYRLLDRSALLEDLWPQEAIEAYSAFEATLSPAPTPAGAQE